MVPSTVVGVLVLMLVVLPGLVYTLAFEREAGDYGATFADRTFRFVSVSAIFHVLVGWPEYWLYRATLAEGDRILAGEFALLWTALLLALVLPLAAGSYLGGWALRQPVVCVRLPQITRICYWSRPTVSTLSLDPPLK